MASNYMVKVYADLIRKGKKTIEEVPDQLRAAPSRGNPRK